MPPLLSTANLKFIAKVSAPASSPPASGFQFTKSRHALNAIGFSAAAIDDASTRTLMGQHNVVFLNQAADATNSARMELLRSACLPQTKLIKYFNPQNHKPMATQEPWPSFWSAAIETSNSANDPLARIWTGSRWNIITAEGNANILSARSSASMTAQTIVGSDPTAWVTSNAFASFDTYPQKLTDRMYNWFFNSADPFGKGWYSRQFDGIYQDNFQYRVKYPTHDLDRDQVNNSNATADSAISWWHSAMLGYKKHWDTLNTVGLQFWANAGGGAPDGSSQGYLQAPEVTNKIAFATLEGKLGRTWSRHSAFGFSATNESIHINWANMAETSGGQKAAVFGQSNQSNEVGAGTSAKYQWFRYGYCWSLMFGTTASPMLYHWDITGDYNTVELFDEWNDPNSADSFDHIGDPVDPIQSAPAGSGHYMRRYQNALILMTPKSAGGITNLSLPVLSAGKHYQYINGTQAPTINTGATAGTVTMPEMDGRIIKVVGAATSSSAPPSSGGVSMLVPIVYTSGTSIPADVAMVSGSARLAKLAVYYSLDSSSNTNSPIRATMGGVSKTRDKLITAISASPARSLGLAMFSWNESEIASMSGHAFTSVSFDTGSGPGVGQRAYATWVYGSVDQSAPVYVSGRDIETGSIAAAFVSASASAGMFGLATMIEDAGSQSVVWSNYSEQSDGTGATRTVSLATKSYTSDVASESVSAFVSGSGGGGNHRVLYVEIMKPS